MGFEVELFVHPERISSQLICPICTSVLERPVQTPTEHLFCEDELLEWMTRSQMCPVTNMKLDPDTIKKPGRIIMNMLSELEMYCPNKIHGCQWVGSCDQVDSHKKKCNNRSKEELLREIEQKDNLIAKLKQKLASSHEKVLELQENNSTLIETNEQLRETNEQLQLIIAANDRKLKVYDAFFRDDKNEEDSDDKNSSSFQQLSRLRKLNLTEGKASSPSSSSSSSSSSLSSVTAVAAAKPMKSKLEMILSSDSKE